jgi:hypothetical protein
MALLTDTFAALMMKAMAKRMAATNPSMRAVLPSLNAADSVSAADPGASSLIRRF